MRAPTSWRDPRVDPAVGRWSTVFDPFTRAGGPNACVVSGCVLTLAGKPRLIRGWTHANLSVGSSSRGRWRSPLCCLVAYYY